MEIKVLNNYSKHLIAIIVFIAIFLQFYAFSYADINTVLSVQGKLTNSDGTNIGSSCASGNTCDFRVSIYDAQTSGNLLWQETHSNLNVSSGIFSIKVGSITSLDDVDLQNFNRNDLWLEIEFDPDGDGDFAEGETFDRTRFNSVPFAMNARYFNGLSSDRFLTLSPNYPVTSTYPGPLLWLNKNNETGDLFVVQKNGVDTFLISNSGFTGLGTSSPLAMLNVNSKLADDYLLLSGTSTGVGLKISYFSSSTSSVGIKIENSSTGEITTAIDVSDPEIVNAINLGTNNIVSTDSGTVDWNDSAGNNLLRLSDIATNFGASLDAGAFMDRNSYFSEEFNKEIDDRNNDGVWGDNTELFTDERGTCIWSIVDDMPNGISRSRVNGNNTSCDLVLSNAIPPATHAIFDSAYLPVFMTKVRPSSIASTNYLYTGLTDGTQPGATSISNPPDNGIYFSKGSAGNIWTGVTRTGAVSTEVTCTGQNIDINNFALLKIEVRSTSDVRFYVDNNLSDGVSWFYCGQSTTNIPTIVLAYRTKFSSTTAGPYVDIDYVRVWQDDAPSVSDNIAIANDTTFNGEDELLEESMNNFEGTGFVWDEISGASTSSSPISEYISLSEFESLSNRITTLEELTKQLLEQNFSNDVSSTSELLGVENSIDEINIKNLSVSLNTSMLGDLEVQGVIKINGLLSFSSNNAGSVVIPAGQNKVHVSYGYNIAIPKVILTPNIEGLDDESIIQMLNNGFNYTVANKTNEGFDIIISTPQSYDVTFDWQIFTVH